MEIKEAVQFMLDHSGYEVKYAESTADVAEAFGVKNPVYVYEHDPEPYSKGFHSDTGEDVEGVSMFTLAENICLKHGLGTGGYFGRGRNYREQVGNIKREFAV
jgi:hypothetical protein